MVQEKTENEHTEENYSMMDAVIEKAKVIATGQLNSKSTGSSSASLVVVNNSMDSIVTDYHHLDLEYDTFTGSLEDNVEKPVEPEPEPEEEFSFIPPRAASSSNVINQNVSASTSMGNGINTSDATEAGEQKLNPLKVREINLPIHEYRRKTSNFKAKKVSADEKLSIPGDKSAKIAELTKTRSAFEHKIKKIEQEIDYLEYLITNTPSLEEIGKLNRAKEALAEKLESVKKEKYNSTVKLNHLILRSPNISGGEYWLRSVS